jgi:hypothetical protein
MNVLEKIDDILQMDNVYLGLLPDKPDTCIALFEYSATPPTHSFNATDYTENVQARTRASSWQEAYELALQVGNKLNRYTDREISILASSGILDIGQDGANPPRREYTINFKITRK